MADGKKICKGCNALVAKPVICKVCGVASHPACLGRTGHPFSDGKFKSCIDLSDGSTSVTDHGSAFENRILGLIRAEFEKFNRELVNFKKDIREMYLADIANLQQTIQALSERVDVIENSEPVHLQPVVEEEIMEELLDRERREKNIMIYNLEESISSGNSDSDGIKVKNLLRGIKDVNLDNVKIARLGAKKQGSVRPIKVVMRCKDDALEIVRGRLGCPDPVRIEHDRTPKQRKYLRELKDRLRVLHESGHKEKTIRYFNGVPKIVDVRRSQVSKN